MAASTCSGGRTGASARGARCAAPWPSAAASVTLTVGDPGRCRNCAPTGCHAPIRCLERAGRRRICSTASSRASSGPGSWKSAPSASSSFHRMRSPTGTSPSAAAASWSITAAFRWLSRARRCWRSTSSCAGSGSCAHWSR